jgi:Asp-tRNA(Asn)/Glu-tRNA(Gln) amidotransferase A subunit family amidase
VSGRSEPAVRDCLERIAERDPHVRAWRYVDPEAALEQARAADAEPEPRSPLHGVPVGVKDIIDTGDMPTEYGSPIYAGNRPDADAACVARLRAAGAVILGKTATTEFAYYHPTDTVNPHDPERTPGGSSSGSAAAVADGMVPLALGSQTAGSVIRPASFCGVAGLKVTHGLIDMAGVRPLSKRLDTLGVFAREATQLEPLLAVLAGVEPAPRGEEPPPRIGFARTARWELADADARAALEHAAGRLDAEEIELPDELDEAVDAQARIMAVDVAASAAAEYEHHRDELSEELLELIETGLAIDAAGHRVDLETAERAAAALPRAFADSDVIMALAAPGQALEGLGDTGDPVFCRVWTLLGTPAISVPGMTGADGLPIGVQLVAARGRDAELVAAARWAQERLG